MCSIFANISETDVVAIDTVDPNVVYVVGTKDRITNSPTAIITQTLNGGNTWRRIYTHTHISHFFGIHVPDPCTIWVTGCHSEFADGLVVCSRDGGNTWTGNLFPLSTAGTDYYTYCLYFIRALNDKTVWVCGRTVPGASDAFAVWRTTDAGLTWEKQTAIVPGNIAAIFTTIYIPLDKGGNTVWVSGFGTDGINLIPLLYRTNDALSTNPLWEAITTATEFPNGIWTQVNGVSSGCIWVAGSYIIGTTSIPYIRRTLDGGENWVTLTLPNGLPIDKSTKALVTSIATLPSNCPCPTLWITLSNREVGEGVPVYNIILRSCDGGVTWSQVFKSLYPTEYGELGYDSGGPTLIVRNYLKDRSPMIWCLVGCSSSTTSTTCRTLDLIKLS